MVLGVLILGSLASCTGGQQDAGTTPAVPNGQVAQSSSSRSVPAQLVGDWNGGPSIDSSDYNFRFAADGTYVFWTSNGLRQDGTIDVDGSQMSLQPPVGDSPTLAWEIIAPAGFDILRLISPSGGESSYVRG
jgi:hypothetical protein